MAGAVLGNHPMVMTIPKCLDLFIQLAFHQKPLQGSLHQTMPQLLSMDPSILEIQLLLKECHHQHPSLAPHNHKPQLLSKTLSLSVSLQNQHYLGDS